MKKLIYILCCVLFSLTVEGQIIKAIKTADGFSTTGGLGGALDDGRGFAYGDSIYAFAGTDNSNVFNEVIASGDKGVHWIYHLNAPWSVRNAMCVSNPKGSGKAKMWGGKNNVSPLHDSWDFDPVNGFVLITSAMGGAWNTTMTQYAYATTNTEYLTIAGAQNDSVLASTDLITWTRKSKLPDSIKNTASGSACWDSTSNKLYFVGGFNINLGKYINKLWESTDSGLTWHSIITDVIFGDEWPHILFCNWGAIYIRGNNGLNQKGCYYWRRGTNIADINNWIPFNYELGARHATFVFISLDGNEAYAILGNFWNESWKFIRIDSIIPIFFITRRKKRKYEIDTYSIAA